MGISAKDRKPIGPIRAWRETADVQVTWRKSIFCEQQGFLLTDKPGFPDVSYDAKPKFTAHADPASQWTAARKGPAFFAYSDNCLIDTGHGVVVDVDPSQEPRP